MYLLQLSYGSSMSMHFLFDISGRILSVDTVSLSICRNDFTPGEIDTDRCHWLEEYKYHKFHFLRVFLEAGPPQNELIGRRVWG